MLAQTRSLAALCGALFVFAFGSACGSEPQAKFEASGEPSDEASGEHSRAEPRSEGLAPVSDAAPVSPDVPLVPVELVDFDVDGDEGEALGNLGAMSAWTAALERYRLLDRRGQQGSVFGTLVEGESGPMLVDESFGDGALAISVTLPEAPIVSLPMRAVLWGSWKPDAEVSWRWHTSRVERLAKAKTPTELRPILAPIKASLPKGTTLVSQAPRRGGTISFVVKKRSGRAGDGWLIADDTKARPSARLLLPGERETYGDQSELASSERWKLLKGTRYWVTIRSYRPGRFGELPVLRARSIPAHDRKGPSAAPAPQPSP